MKNKLFLLVLLLAGCYSHLVGQETISGASSSVFDNVSLEIFVLLIIILVLLIIALFLSGMLLQFATLKSQLQSKAIKENKISLFEKLNNTVALKDEDTLDLNHNYDGIRELDNKTPTWWSWSFYATIAFAIIYLLQLYVFESMPGQLAELKSEYESAEILKSQFVSRAASNLDENTVAMLSQDEINKGSMTFSANCAVCHGQKGEGNAVGPNLTDEYWIHKGSLKDIFISIKYGWPEKGMKGWKDDFSPLQIAELTSYVKSLVGTNPPNAKEKQGEIFKDEPGSKVSLTDSIK